MSIINNCGTAIATAIGSRYGIRFVDDSEKMTDTEIISAVIPLSYEPSTGSRCPRDVIQFAVKVVSKKANEVNHFAEVENIIGTLLTTKTIAIDDSNWTVKEIQNPALVDWEILKSGFIRSDILFQLERK